MTCCSPTRQFAFLASDKNFRAIHEIPLPFELKTAGGKMIRFPTPDGKEAGAYAVDAGAPTDRYLLVFHEWWGLNDYIKGMADQLQNALGPVHVLALDLYDGKTATTPGEAGRYMQGVSDARARAIISGALQYAGSKAKIYTIGWCFGGGWSMQAALMAGDRAYGCVLYYGMPETDVDKLKKLHGDVLGIFANKDGWITPAVVADLEAAMKEAGKKLIVHQYDADHGFANPSGARHDDSAARDAYRHAIQFLKTRME